LSLRGVAEVATHLSDVVVATSRYVVGCKIVEHT
jgi:hypothetical protein